MNIDTVVAKLKENDEKLEELKNEKKQIDEEIKLLEEGLIQYCKDKKNSSQIVCSAHRGVCKSTPPN